MHHLGVKRCQAGAHLKVTFLPICKLQQMIMALATTQSLVQFLGNAYTDKMCLDKPSDKCINAKTIILNLKQNKMNNNKYHSLSIINMINLVTRTKMISVFVLWVLHMLFVRTNALVNMLQTWMNRGYLKTKLQLAADMICWKPSA